MTEKNQPILQPIATQPLGQPFASYTSSGMYRKFCFEVQIILGLIF